MVDTKNATLCISKEKQEEILQKCNMLSNRSTVTKRELQSVIGSIMFVHKCVKSSHFFTNRLLNVLRESTSNIIQVTHEKRPSLVSGFYVSL